MYGKIAGLEDVFFFEFDNPITIRWIAVYLLQGNYQVVHFS